MMEMGVRLKVLSLYSSLKRQQYYTVVESVSPGVRLLSPRPSLSLLSSVALGRLPYLSRSDNNSIYCAIELLGKLDELRHIT